MKGNEINLLSFLHRFSVSLKCFECYILGNCYNLSILSLIRNEIVHDTVPDFVAELNSV